jgi:hypothetical protein
MKAERDIIEEQEPSFYVFYQQKILNTYHFNGLKIFCNTTQTDACSRAAE